ncbi:MAG: hypothetical protein JO200_07045 [Comamonas sp.]|nr:hypothetical protein [Comamonas sp.]
MSADMHEDDAAKPLGVPQIEAFWKDFSDRLEALEMLDGRDFVERANELLQSHAPGLAIELEGRVKEAGSRLVISAHGNTAQFENAQAVVRHAPRLERYSVQAFRSRTLGSDFAMRMEDFELSSTDVQVAYYDAGGVIGLELAFAKPIPPAMAEHAQHMAFIMLDHVLGEWDFSVRVGPVEFVAEISDGLSGPVPLSAFPPIFDAFQREQLGRSYEYPQDQSAGWISLEVRTRDAAEDDPPDILSFHDGANAVATRADLSHFLQWRLPFSSQQELDSVRDAQDAMDAELAREQSGILVFSRLENMNSRLAAFYVEDPAQAAQLARRLGARHAPALDAELSLSFDPAWNEYLSLHAAIHRQDRGDEEDES